MPDSLRSLDLDKYLINVSPFLYAREYVQAKGDFNKLAAKKHGEFDLATIRETNLRRIKRIGLMERTEDWWKGIGHGPSDLHLWAICFDFSRFSGELDMWIKENMLG